MTKSENIAVDTLEESADQEQTPTLTKWQAFRKEWGGFIILLICLFTFRSVVADWNAVPTGSMKPTIYEGDRIWVDKLAYGLRIPFTDIRVKTLGQPERGEIVVFPEPISGKRYIKRVIAVPGDKVEVNGNLVYLNDELIQYRQYEEEELRNFANVPASKGFPEEFSDVVIRMEETIGGVSHSIQLFDTTRIKPLRHASHRKILVPEGKIFVMGDNRDESQDSRVIGLVDSNTLIGKATRVAWSHDYDDYYIPRKERFFKPIDELSELD